MYSPSEVMVGDSCIWILDEDSESNEWIVNNDLVLMQSTGLTDSAEKEIFEGDILSIETDEENVKVEVSWDSKHALFVFESKKYNEKEALGELFEDNSYPFKIIGNIYENPELVKVSS
jgi:hypothetical protein